MAGKEIRVTWADILGAWIAVELDFQDAAVYGIDLESGILSRRSWRWFELRIVGLISNPSSRLYRRLTATPATTTPGVADVDAEPDWGADS